MDSIFAHIKVPLFFVLCLCAHSGCRRRIPWFKTYHTTQLCHTPKLQELPIVVIVPSYNNRDWYRYNLDSIIRQKYHNFRVYYYDDHSPDGTGNLVETYVKKQHITNITLIKNKQRRGALANIWHGISACVPHELVVNLDGDDWLANDHVLADINHRYQTNDIWLTYGQFINWPTGERGWCKPIPPAVIAHNMFRQHGFWFAQLRTYYAWLAQKINPHDLLDPKTESFYTVAGDAALMFAMVEMAGTHIQYIDDILYIRNVATPINDFKCHHDQQIATAQQIRQQPAYRALPVAGIPRSNKPLSTARTSARLTI